MGSVADDERLGVSGKEADQVHGQLCEYRRGGRVRLRVTVRETYIVLDRLQTTSDSGFPGRKQTEFTASSVNTGEGEGGKA